MEKFRRQFGLNIIKVDAKERFLSKLLGFHPEENARSNEFVYVFDDEATKLAMAKKAFLFCPRNPLYRRHQSELKLLKTIKSQLTVGGLPEDM